MRVCDRCRLPRELVQVPMQMAQPVELCPPCVSDFFEWVCSGPSGRKQRRDKGQPRGSYVARSCEQESACRAPDGMLVDAPDLPPMTDFSALVETAE